MKLKEAIEIVKEHNKFTLNKDNPYFNALRELVDSAEKEQKHYDLLNYLKKGIANVENKE